VQAGAIGRREIRAAVAPVAPLVQEVVLRMLAAGARGTRWKDVGRAPTHGRRNRPRMSGRPGVAGRRASASVCVSNCAARSSSRTRFSSLAIAPTQPRPSTGSTLASTPAAFASLPPPGKQSKSSGPAPWLLERRRATNRRHPGDFCIVIGDRQSGTAHQVARAQIVRGRSHLKATADFRLTGSAIC
jgi:hypothetical protein